MLRSERLAAMRKLHGSAEHPRQGRHWAVQIQLGGEDDRSEWTLLRRPSGTPSDGYTDLGT